MTNTNNVVQLMPPPSNQQTEDSIEDELHRSMNAVIDSFAEIELLSKVAGRQGLSGRFILTVVNLLMALHNASSKGDG